MRLTEIKKLEGTIELRTGLHIGAGDTEMHIGGTDNPVIKHPHTGKPYIPGSSLKGKTRSLLELASGLMVYTDGSPVGGGTLKSLRSEEERKTCESILKVFGSSGADLEDQMDLGPTRVSFGDCFLDEDWVKEAKEKRWSFTEVKSENSINRIRGTAENPRFTERVPSGARFRFLISFKVFEGDGDGLLYECLLKGLKLLELDSLGGNGSRGYGKVSFKFHDEGLQKKFETLLPLNGEKVA